MKRLSKVKIEWSADFAYAVGLLATDGNLSKDGRHMNMTSKDKELIITFKKCLGLKNKIGRKTRGKSKIKKYFQVQFGDKNFYDFLLKIGFTPAKSKTLGKIKLPKKYFADFFRGCIDGDGNIDIHSHPESKHPQLRIRLNTASINFAHWAKEEVTRLFRPNGGWIDHQDGMYILSYGKADTIKLLNGMYYSRNVPCLKRKHIIAKTFLRM
ncbi:MAG: hypothetical protein Q8O83_01225 [bacterium]|nr:hypothetical protein [bacterium]